VGGIATQPFTLVLIFLVGLAIGAAVATWLGRILLQGERRTREERENAHQSADRQLRESFQALSAEALQNNNKFFLELAQRTLGEQHEEAARTLEAREKAINAMVKPVTESLTKVDTKLTQIEKERHGHYSSLVTQLKAVSESHDRLHNETSNLVTALRAPSVRGRWGEMQLKRVVEMAGMLEHCDFSEQVSVSSGDGDGGRLRPDLIVHLPGGKHVVVDAKVPLEAYLDAHEAVDEATRKKRAKDHARQVRQHMTQLGSKGYWNQFEATPEFVVMFLPSESIYSAAFEQDPNLLEFGVDQQVIVSSPTTLIALLRAVAYGWQQEKLAENATKISQLGRELHDRVATLAGHFHKVGKRLDSTVAAYNDAVGSLESRVLVSARRFSELGAASSQAIPELEVVDHRSRPLRAGDTSSESAKQDGGDSED
jgi:DNA recombination protein RmuC